MVWGGVPRGINSHLIVIAANFTAERHRDEVPQLAFFINL